MRDKRVGLLFAAVLLFSCGNLKESTENNAVYQKQVQHYSSHSPTAHLELIVEVLEASKNWIDAFNKGDIATCVNSYTAEGIMRAAPVGKFLGRNEINSFWDPFIKSGAGNLIYRNVSVTVLNDSTATLSADWTMNVGEGVIYEEKWVKQAGTWKVAYDDFEVFKNYDEVIVRNESPTKSHDELIGAVKACMDFVTKGFNVGRGPICAEGYASETIMNDIPVIQSQDKETIEGFWTDLIAKGAGNLIYHLPTVKQTAPGRIKLSADWSMNIGYGKIYHEKWVQQNGKWLLGYDEFEISEFYK